jgi:hypothetical protein
MNWEPPFFGNHIAFKIKKKKGKKEDINFNQKTPRTSTVKRTSFLDDLLQL